MARQSKIEIFRCQEIVWAYERIFEPSPEDAAVYRDLFQIYKDIYPRTKELNQRLKGYRSIEEMND